MNSSLKLLVIVFVMHMAISTSTADDLSFGQPNIPASLWQQHPEGITLALTLSTQTEKGVQKSSIKIHIKNTSRTDKNFIVSGADSGIRIYYIDSQDSQVPLHNYNRDDEVTERIFSVIIKPDKTLSCSVTLTPNELILIQSHPVLCSFTITDPTSKQHYTIESTPKMLSVER